MTSGQLRTILVLLVLGYPRFVRPLESSVPEHELLPRNFNPHPYEISSTVLSNFQHPYAILATKAAKDRRYHSTKRLDKFHAAAIKSLGKFARDYLGLSANGKNDRLVFPQREAPETPYLVVDNLIPNDAFIGHEKTGTFAYSTHHYPNQYQGGFLARDTNVNSRGQIILGTVNLAGIQSGRGAIPEDAYNEYTEEGYEEYLGGGGNVYGLSPIEVAFKLSPLTNHREDPSTSDNSLGAYQNVGIGEEPIYETRSRHGGPGSSSPRDNFVDGIRPDDRFYSASVYSDSAGLIRFHE